jgi:acetate kinase
MSQNLVLALNAGSSSLKVSVLRSEETVVSFLAERLCTPDATIRVSQKGKAKEQIQKEGNETYDHAVALDKIIGYLKKNDMLSDLICVGHRVVHGGTIFSDSAVVSDESLEQIASVSHLAPL